MKPGSKADEQKKLIGLIVGIVLTIIFIGFRLSSSMGGGTPPPAGGNVEVIGGPGASSGVAVAPAGGTPVASNTAAGAPLGALDDQIDAPTFLPSETPNPFHKDVIGGATLGSTASVLDAPPATAPRGGRRNPRIRRGPHKGDEPLDPDMIGSLPDSGTLSKPPVLQPEAEPMQVMGVTTGMNPVAVIRVGSKDYVQTRGVSFANGLRVKEISESQVVIEQGGTLHILRVGTRPVSSSPSSGPSPQQSAPIPTTFSKPIGSLRPR